MVRNAAILAVYDEIMIRVKNHQTPATKRVDVVFGEISEPISNKGNIVKVRSSNVKSFHTVY